MLRNMSEKLVGITLFHFSSDVSKSGFLYRVMANLYSKTFQHPGPIADSVIRQSHTLPNDILRSLTNNGPTMVSSSSFAVNRQKPNPVQAVGMPFSWNTLRSVSRSSSETTLVVQRGNFFIANPRRRTASQCVASPYVRTSFLILPRKSLICF
jgi:hypothetical protein